MLVSWCVLSRGSGIYMFAWLFERLLIKLSPVFWIFRQDKFSRCYLPLVFWSMPRTLFSCKPTFLISVKLETRLIARYLSYLFIHNLSRVTYLNTGLVFKGLCNYPSKHFPRLLFCETAAFKASSSKTSRKIFETSRTGETYNQQFSFPLKLIPRVQLFVNRCFQCQRFVLCKTFAFVPSLLFFSSFRCTQRSKYEIVRVTNYNFETPQGHLFEGTDEEADAEERKNEEHRSMLTAYKLDDTWVFQRENLSNASRSDQFSPLDREARNITSRAGEASRGERDSLALSVSRMLAYFTIHHRYRRMLVCTCMWR